MNTLQVLLVACALAGASAGQNPAPVKPAPTVFLNVSEKVVNALVEKPVQRVDPVREIILDAQVFGESLTRGKVSAQLHASPTYGLVELIFPGQTYSRTIGFQEPIKAYSETLVNFEVRKTLVIDGKRVCGYPARACAKACTRLLRMTNFQGETEVTSVDLGRRQFHMERDQIEHESARKAECRLAPRFNQDTMIPLEQANQSLAEGMTQMRRLGLPLQAWQWSSTSSHLQFAVPLGSQPPVIPPPELVAQADVAVRVHQNVIQEFAEVHLGKQTMNLVELASRIEKILGPVLGETKPNANTEKMAQFFKLLGLEPLSLTFVPKQPMTVVLDNQGFIVTFHGTSFRSGKTNYPARDIRAIYKIEQTPQGIAAVRQGLPEVLTPGTLPDPEDLKTDKAFHDLLQNSFGLLMLERLALEDVTLPIQSEQPLLLQPLRAEARNGWLQLAWVRKMPEKK